MLAGLARDDSESSTVKFRGGASIHSETTIIGETFGNELPRESNEVLLFEVNFPTTVVVTANIEAFSLIEIQVVLLSHAIEIDALAVTSDNADVKATLSVATTVQCKYSRFLGGFSLSLLPPLSPAFNVYR